MELFFNKKIILWIAMSLAIVVGFTYASNEYANESIRVAKAAEVQTVADTDGAGTDAVTGGVADATGTGDGTASDPDGETAATATPSPTPKLPSNLNYVSEVRLFQGENMSMAYQSCAGAGFKAVTSDMNEGTEKSKWGNFMSDKGSGDTVILGYKTTKDRSKAITSMKMAEMDTGYQMFDYDEIEKSMNTGMNYLAEDIVAVMAEIRQNVDSGDSYAGKVKEALNLYYIPYMNNMGLGDLIFDPATDTAKIAQVLKRCNLSVITSLMSDLTMGVAGTPVSGQEGNLAERIANNSKAISEMNKSDYVTLDSLYKDDVKDIRQALQNYANEIEPALKLYQDAGGSMSESFMDEHPGEALSVGLYEKLNSYAMADGTGVGTYLLRLGSTTLKSKDDMRAAYPVVMAMSPGQLMMFSYTGVFDAATYMDESSEAVSVSDDVVAETKNKIKKSGLSGVKDGRLPIYPPGQDALYRSRVAMTSEAIRSASAREEYNKITQYDKDMELWEKVYTWSNRIMVFSMAACAIASGVTWVIAHTSAKWLLQTAAMQVFTKLGWPIRLLGSNWVTFIIMIVIIIVWYCVLKIKANYKYYNPDMSEVPRYMYSVEKIEDENGKKENAYILYKPTYNGYIQKRKEQKQAYGEIKEVWYNVWEDYEEINYGDSPETIRKKEEHNKRLTSDFNAGQGKKWNALYTTKDPRAGSPICAENVDDIFMIKAGEYNREFSGYQSFSSFGNDNPVNLNSNQYADDAGGIYLYYRTEETILDPEATSFKVNGKYVSDMVLVSEKKEADAKAAIRLKEGKYYFLDQNLTPDQGCYTYLGYSVTEYIDDAIRDIRVDCVSTGNSMSGGYRRNDVGYAEVGSTAKGNIISLYQTAVNKGETDLAGTVMSYSGAPILADFKIVDSIDKAPVGYEPILLGSGGAAFNFNTLYKKNKEKNNRYVYFQPAVSFVPKGADVKEKKGVTYVYSDEEYVSGIQAFVWAATMESLKDFKNRISAMGYTLFDVNINEKFRMYEEREPDNTCFIGYAKTRNPFRALGDVRYYKGNTFCESLPNSVSSASGTYLAMDVHVFGDPPDIGFGDHGLSTAKGYCGTDMFMISGDYYRKGIRDKYQKKRTFTKEKVESWQHANVKDYLGMAERVLYTLGADEAHPALKPSDILVTKQSSPPAGMRSIAYMTNPYMTENFDISPFQAGVHFYIRRDAESRGAYVSGIYVASYTPSEKMSSMEKYFTYKTADDSTKLMAYGGCNGEVLETNLAVEQKYAWYNYLDADSSPVKKTRENYYYCGDCLKGDAKKYTYVGVSYTDDPDEALTGIIRYRYTGEDAPEKISVGGIKYNKAGSAVGDYYYYTTTSENSSPGSPITDISFDEVLTVGGSASIRKADNADPGDLQQRLNDVDRDNSLKPYEKIMKKKEIRKNAVELKCEKQNGIIGHLKADTSESAISELFIGHGKNQEEAISDAMKQGANYVYSYNTNLGTEGNVTATGYNKGLPFGGDTLDPVKQSSPYNEVTCIGYNVEPVDDEEGFGIRDILITSGVPYKEDGFCKGDCEYMPVSDVSLNSGTDGEELYMYCSYDESDVTSSPIVSLALAKGDSIPAGAGEVRYEYIMTDTGEKADLNRGATAVRNEKMQDTRLWLFAHRYDNTAKSGALFDITDLGRKTVRMDVTIGA